MSFVVTSGNKQYLVKNGQKIIVDRINADVDSVVELPVLHSSDKAKTIKATVVQHQRGEKIRVVKYKAKSNYHRQYGHRPEETVLKIEGEFDIPSKATAPAKKSTSKATKASKPATAKKEAAKTTAKKASTATKKTTAKKTTK